MERSSVTIHFVDQAHMDFYEENIERTKSHRDPFRKALFYTLGIISKTRECIDQIYDFEKKVIKPDSLSRSWQTGTTLQITRLAFNLYNGFHQVNDNDDSSYLYTPYHIFNVDNEWRPFMLEAVKVRFTSS